MFWCPWGIIKDQLLRIAEGAKVKAERALHELQLDMRSQVEKYNQLHEARRDALA